MARLASRRVRAPVAAGTVACSAIATAHADPVTAVMAAASRKASVALAGVDLHGVARLSRPR
ncbi:hypothetical protein AFE02nite_07750 [Actinotalea fermentans]|uniref:Uncharacterized protein n=1 Tax=Actinotalea fermentans TaxID=43671 RepID=A0A511YV13_9CELL|nr:hypothetical protein AFE02nite_07750 [Actinotalea fermentans]